MLFLIFNSLNLVQYKNITTFASLKKEIKKIDYELRRMVEKKTFCN